LSEPLTGFAVQTHSSDETSAVGAVVGGLCAAGDIIALEGELGAGKTQFVRGLALGLGLNPRHVSSPTFVLVQEYEPAESNSRKPILVHIDAYRIKSAEDLASIGWHGHGEEMREQAVVAVEWASLIRPALGEDVLCVKIEHEPGGRRVLLSASGSWRTKIRQLSEQVRVAGMPVEEGAQP